MSDQWQNQKLLTLFYSGISSGLPSATYRVANEHVYISGLEVHDVSMGTVQFISGLTLDRYREIFVQTLVKEQTRVKRERENDMADQTEATLQRARKIGEKWGYWILALNPDMPFTVVREMSMELAKLYGFGDIDSAMEFGGAIYDKYTAYHEANSRQIEERKPGHDLV